MSQTEYKLPMELAVAISTNRTQFVDFWINENPDERKEIGQMLKDLLEDRAKLKGELELLKSRLAGAVGSINKLNEHVAVITKAINGID